MRFTVRTVTRPIATTMVFLALALLGLVAYSRLGVDLLPDIAIPRLVVSTVYRDATPEEVETLITEPLEAAASTVQGVKSVKSVSRDGVSILTLEFVWGTAMDYAVLALREKLDNARFALPREAGRPTITRLDPASLPIMTLALSHRDTSGGTTLRHTNFVHQYSDTADVERLIALKEAGRLVFKRRLEQIPGVAQALITGGLEREIIVEFDPEKLSAYGLTLEEADKALKASNLSIPAGSIMQGQMKYSLRALGEFRSLSDIRQTVIRRGSDEALLLLSDLAMVRMSCKERTGLTRFDGSEAIGIQLFKDAAANTVEIAQRVRTVCDTLHKEYTGFRVAVVADNSRFIEAAVDNVRQEIVYGGILAIVALFLFLRSARNIIIIGITIPVALVITALLLYLFNVSFNIISLGGIAVGVGLLLDGSIVMIESISRKRQAGLSAQAAALESLSEVGKPIAAGTITTMAVFLPLVFLKGFAGELFKDQSYAVVFSLFASLMTALTLIPMLSVSLERKIAQFRDNSGIAKIRFLWFGQIFDYLERAVQRSMHTYDRILLVALRYPARTLLFTGFLVVLTIVVAVIMPKEFIPDSGQEEFVVMLEFPPGTPLQGSAKRVERVEKALLAMPEVLHHICDIGIVNELALVSSSRPVSSPVSIVVQLRSITYNELVQRRLRDVLAEMSDVRYAFQLRESAFSQIIQPSERDLVIRVQNRDLNRAFEEALGIVSDVRKTMNAGEMQSLSAIAPATDKSEPQFLITINREQCLRYGIQAGEAARAIAEMTKGKVSTTFTEFDKKIDILLRPIVSGKFLQPNRTTLEEPSLSIEELFRQHIQIPSRAAGAAAQGAKGVLSLPVSALAHWQRAETFREIRREDALRTVYVYADVAAGANLEDAVRQVEKVIQRRAPSPQGRTTIGGTNEEISEAFFILYIALGISALLMYTVLAVEFESLLYPLIIMFSVPLGLIGAVITLYLAGASLNIVSLMGLVILIGIADNDAVVKVETILFYRKKGLALHDAIVTAGQERFRPIVMNSLTVIFGLIPMMVGSGAATQLRTSLSLAVIGGLISATALTLVVIPVLYQLAEKIKYGKKGNE